MKNCKLLIVQLSQTSPGFQFAKTNLDDEVVENGNVIIWGRSYKLL